MKTTSNYLLYVSSRSIKKEKSLTTVSNIQSVFTQKLLKHNNTTAGV